jgi:hypothetical protein
VGHRVQWLGLAATAAAACTFGSAADGGGSLPDTTSGSTAAEPATTNVPPDPDTSSGATGTGGPASTTSTEPSTSSDTAAATSTSTDSTSSDSTGSGETFVLCDAGDPDLRACYDFVGAESGVLTDLSSHGNDGTVSAAVVVSAGPFGSTVQPSARGEIRVPDSSSFDLVSPALSFDAWVWLQALPLAGQRAGVLDDDGQYSLFVYADQGVRCGFGPVEFFGPQLPLGQWVHVACVGEAGTSRMYIDGVEVATAGDPGQGSAKNVADIAIGDNSSAFGEPLDGQLAAVRVWSRTLSPAEVAEAALAAGG